jgi:hypothetical protein
MQATISTIASIVSIVGGIVGIYSSLRRRSVSQALAAQTPVPARDAHLPRSAPLSGASPSAPEASASSAPQSETTFAGPGVRQSQATFTFLLAIVLSVLALLIITGLRAYLFQPAGGTADWIAAFLALGGLAMLAIIAGLLPTRRGAAYIAAALLGVVLALAVVVGLILATVIPGPDYSFTATDWIVLGIFGMTSLAISLLAGWVGVALRRRALRPLRHP